MKLINDGDNMLLAYTETTEQQYAGECSLLYKE